MPAPGQLFALGCEHIEGSGDLGAGIGGTVRGLNSYGLPRWRATAVRYRYERTGFGYGAYDNSPSYGHSLSSPAWVFRQLARVSGLRVVHFAEAAWTGHHDVYACVLDPTWRVHHPPTSALKFVKHTIREHVRPRLRPDP